MPALYFRRQVVCLHLRVCALVSQAKARFSVPGSRWSEQTGLPRTKTAFFPILAHLPRIFPPTPAHRSLRAGPQISRVYLGTHVCTNCSYPHFLHGSPWKSSANMVAFLPPVDEDGSLIRPQWLNPALGLLPSMAAPLFSSWTSHAQALRPAVFDILACLEMFSFLTLLVAGWISSIMMQGRDTDYQLMALLCLWHIWNSNRWSVLKV